MASLTNLWVGRPFLLESVRTVVWHSKRGSRSIFHLCPDKPDSFKPQKGVDAQQHVHLLLFWSSLLLVLAGPLPLPLPVGLLERSPDPVPAPLPTVSIYIQFSNSTSTFLNCSTCQSSGYYYCCSLLLAPPSTFQGFLVPLNVLQSASTLPVPSVASKVSSFTLIQLHAMVSTTFNVFHLHLNALPCYFHIVPALLQTLPASFQHVKSTCATTGIAIAMPDISQHFPGPR